MFIVGVTGGVDTHADVHIAAAVDHNGGLLGIESFPTNGAGYENLLGWLVGFGEVIRIGVEGTGSYGVGLSRFLAGPGIDGVEVDRPNRQVGRSLCRSLWRRRLGSCWRCCVERSLSLRPPAGRECGRLPNVTRPRAP